MALQMALCTFVFVACREPGWGGQSKPQEKETTGEQAGSSGKTPEPMRSQGATESPLQKCDPDPPKKHEKKKKSKKPDTNKSSGSSSSN